MNEQDKSLELAELMGWEKSTVAGIPPTYLTAYKIEDGTQTQMYLEPYQKTTSGLAQFAAILLKFPEVMQNVYSISFRFEPTQSNILDEILRING